MVYIAKENRKKRRSYWNTYQKRITIIMYVVYINSKTPWHMNNICIYIWINKTYTNMVKSGIISPSSDRKNLSKTSHGVLKSVNRREILAYTMWKKYGVWRETVQRVNKDHELTWDMLQQMTRWRGCFGINEPAVRIRCSECRF